MVTTSEPPSSVRNENAALLGNASKPKSSLFGRAEVQELSRVRESGWDFCFYLIFLTAILGFMSLACFGSVMGYLERLTRPSDVSGLLCGLDSPVLNQPFAYAPNPFVQMFVCVESCDNADAVAAPIPDGPMGKEWNFSESYPSKPYYGRPSLCLPDDLDVSRFLVKSTGVREEVYRSVGGGLFADSAAFGASLCTSALIALWVALRPSFSVILSCVTSGVLSALFLAYAFTGTPCDECSAGQLGSFSNPTGCRATPFVAGAFGLIALYVGMRFFLNARKIQQGRSVYLECVRVAHTTTSVVPLTVVSTVLLVLVAVEGGRMLGLGMSMVDEFPTKIDLFGRAELVPLTDFDPKMSTAVFVSAMSLLWLILSLRGAVLYLQSHLFSQYYFARVASTATLSSRSRPSSPWVVGLSYLLRYHMGSIAISSLFHSSRHTISMMAVLGKSIMTSRWRARELMARWKGKIQDLSAFTAPLECVAVIACGCIGAATFFLTKSQFSSSEVLSLSFSVPIVFVTATVVSETALQMLSAGSASLTVCYCIDVEMAGGSETDAMYVSRSLADVFNDASGIAENLTTDRQ